MSLVCRVCSAPLPDGAAEGALCPACSASADRTIVDSGLAAARMGSPIRETIGSYEILEKLGQGGMGAVYRARQVTLDRVVALKVLPGQFADDADFIGRFQREAKVASGLHHPNVVSVHDYGSADGCHFIAMELIDGENLHERLRRGTMDFAEALSVTDYVARGLKCGWESAQLVHRDIKPSNIYLSYDGEVKVGDLGLAKSVTSNTTGITQTGAMMGTPHYMSPEQCRGDKVIDFRADIYSLGCTLFEMLTGKPPFPGNDPVAIVRKHLDVPPPGLLKVLPNCPHPLALLVGRMLKKAPRERHSSYGELIAEIEALYRQIEQGVVLQGTIAARRVGRPATTPPPKRASPTRGLWVSVLTLVCAIGLGVGWWLKRPASSVPAADITDAEPASPPPAEPAGTPSAATPGAVAPPAATATPALAAARPATPPPSTPKSATPAPATPLPLADLPAGTVVTLAKDTRVNLRFGASTIPKGTRLTLLAVAGQQVRARFGSDLVTVPVTDIIVPTVLPAAGKTATMSAATPAPDPLLAASRNNHFTNSLGMKFLPVPGTDVLFCIHETRRKDYAAYAAATPGVDAAWESRNIYGYVFGEPADEYPVTVVNWNDAKAFCAWLSAKEGRTYRLPTDREWSGAVGIGREETWKEDTTPATVFKVRDVFAWGEGWPPPPRAGNFADESCRAKVAKWTDPVIEGYDDGFPTLAPVMTFSPNPFGIFDLAGNALEWCEDWYDLRKDRRGIRGSAWKSSKPDHLLASNRNHNLPDKRLSDLGFRVVVELPRPALAATTSPIPWPGATPAPVRKPRTFAAAPKSDFTNTLGMKFIKVRGTNVHFCIHETRYQDYAAYAAEAPGVDGTWAGQVFDGFDIADWPEEHPVVNVTWEEARKFCEWLSGKEGKLYRLPRDEEWSHAAGIGRGENWKKDTTPETVFKNPDEFPWGTRWPPIKGSGNFNDESRTGKRTPDRTDYFGNYLDGFPTTAPVMSFKPNQQNLYDLGGNVWEWCDDWFDINHLNRTKRGGSWTNNERGYLLSSARMSSQPDGRWSDTGFRVVMDPTVLVARVTAPAKPAAPPIPAPAPAAPAADGWADLLNPLTPEMLARTGHGWTMKDGALHSPSAPYSALPLPGSFAGTSYQVRVKLRQTTPKSLVRVNLPVGDRMTAFEMDWTSNGETYTGLSRVGGKSPSSSPAAIKGKQIKDDALHDLEISVRLDGENATIATTLDTRPIFQWTGPTAHLTLDTQWMTDPPGAIAIGTMAEGWVISEVKAKRESAPAPAAVPAPAPAPAPAPVPLPRPVVAADGWADLLAPLTPALVEQTGSGWRLEGGALHSPNTKSTLLALPGDYSAASYHVRMTVRQLAPKESLSILLPVADRNVGFAIDGWPNTGHYTSLNTVNGLRGNTLPGAIAGKQVKDSEPHTVEVIVRLDGANVKITSTLDAQPLYEWAGPVAALATPRNWAAAPLHAIAIGTQADDWVVSEVKVTRLNP